MGAPQCQPGSWLGPELHKALWGVRNLSVGGEGWGTRLCPGMGTLKPWVMQMGVRLWFGVQILTPCVYAPSPDASPTASARLQGFPWSRMGPRRGVRGSGEDAGRTRDPGEAGGSLG